MIRGFDIETAPLTSDELIAAETIASIIKSAIGEAHAVRNRDIAVICKDKGVALSLPEPRIRKIINHLCHYRMPNICATSKGYFLPKDQQEMEDYLYSLKNRIDAITARYDKAKEYYISKINSSQGKLLV